MSISTTQSHLQNCCSQNVDGNVWLATCARDSRSRKARERQVTLTDRG